MDEIFSPERLKQYALHEVVTQEPAKKSDPGRVPRWVALLASNLADAGTTHAALNRGAVEKNPLMKGIAGNPAALYATKAGLGVLEAWLMDKIAQSKPKVANGVAAGLSGFNTAVAINNARQGKK